MCPGVRLEEELRWSVYPFHGVMCSGHAQDPDFAPSSSEVAVGLFGLFVSCYAVMVVWFSHSVVSNSFRPRGL